MTRRSFYYSCPLIVFWLVGCASAPLVSLDATHIAPAPTIHSFKLHASFSVQVLPEATRQGVSKHYAGQLRWSRNRKTDHLIFFSPFGQTTAELKLSPGSAWLKNSAGEMLQQDGEEAANKLLRRVLGYALPLSSLADWLFIRVNEEDTFELDKRGRVAQVRASGWSIRYNYLDDANANNQGMAQLHSIDIERSSEVKLRLHPQRWDR